MENMTLERVIYYPYQADGILENAAPNRNISMSWARTLGKRMLHGLWKAEQSIICFDTDGRLADGQHRMMACKIANVPFETLVIRNMPKDAIYDDVRKRVGKDQIRINGKVPNDLLPMIPAVRKYLSLRNSFDADWVDAETFITENEDVVRKTMKFCNYGTNKPLCKLAPVQASILAALIAGVDENVAEQFTRCVNSGLNIGDKQTSAMRLIQRINTHKTKGRGTVDELAAYTQTCLRDFAKGKPVLRAYKDGEYTMYYIPEANKKFAEKR